MGDVENEIPCAVFPVADKSAAGRPVRNGGDGRYVHAVTAQPLDVEAAEIVIANSRDNAGAAAATRDLIDENGGRAAWKGADQRLRLEKAVAHCRRHDFHEDFTRRNGRAFRVRRQCGYLPHHLLHMHSAPTFPVGANPRRPGSVIFRISVKIYARQDIF